MTNLWTALKTLLFSTVMLSQSVLSTIIYVPPPKATSDGPQFVPPVVLATSVLEILHHLAFVISKFGGVTATEPSATGQGGSFKELKGIFYSALDILSSDPTRSEAFVSHLANAHAAGPGSVQGEQILLLLEENIAHI